MWITWLSRAVLRTVNCKGQVVVSRTRHGTFTAGITDDGAIATLYDIPGSMKSLVLD